MPVSNLGRIGFVTRGDWSAGSYKYLDVVKYKQSTWICAVPTTAEEPSTGADWQNALSVPSVVGLTNWNELSGEQSPPLIVYDDNKYWSLTSTVSDIALNKPAVSPAFFKVISDSYIDDSSVSADKTWSSEKTASELGTKFTLAEVQAAALSF